MKWLINAALLLLPIFTFAQQETPLNNGIGVNLTHSYDAGLGVSLNYTRQIKGRGILKFEFNTNLNNTYIGRLGYEFIQLRKEKFEIGIGADLKYRYEDLTEFSRPKFHEYALEIPLELRYNISPSYTFKAGISLSQRISSSKDVNIEHKTLSEIRVGLGYKF